MHLNLSEHFGPTIQGEGRHAGALASFVRLAGCNLTCSWCDSAYTWDWDRFDRSEEVHPTEVEDAAAQLPGLPGRLVITGGEPLLQSLALGYLMRSPQAVGRQFDLETNGTRPLGTTAGLWSTVTCSPKVIPSADQGLLARRLNDEVLEVADFKFVVQDEADLDAVDAFVAEHQLPAERVWLMPEGTSPEVLSERTPYVAQAAVDRRMNFSSRLHVYAWHDVRGH